MRHSKLVGAVSNCAVSTYPGTYAVRLETAPTGGESVHLFLQSTIICGVGLQSNRLRKHTVELAAMCRYKKALDTNGLGEEVRDQQAYRIEHSSAYAILL